TGTLTATDADMKEDGTPYDTLSYWIKVGNSTAASHEGTYGTLQVTKETGEYTYTLKEGVDVTSDQTDTFTIWVTDQGGGTEQNITFTVTDVVKSGESSIVEPVVQKDVTDGAEQQSVPLPEVQSLFGELFHDAGEVTLAAVPVVSLTEALPQELELGNPQFKIGSPVEVEPVATPLDVSHLYMPEPQQPISIEDPSAQLVQKALAEQGCL
ncbi:MAG: hypothetical protein RRY20_09155, partial [Bilophila sp.]